MLSLQREKWVLIVVTAMQVTHVLDFVIMMPLGPQFMRIFNINPQQFSVLVSTYTFSAAIFGFLGAFISDRFDRKKLLIFLYFGFIAGTFVCALAPTYEVLVLARAIAGGFGGILGATVFSIIGDLVPESRRGAAMGMVMSSFSISSVLGVPAGLFLANTFGWHSTFWVMGILSLFFLAAAFKVIPPVRDHLTRDHKPDAFYDMLGILKVPTHWFAFSLTIAMTISGFLVIPFISPNVVSNLNYLEKDLTFMYLCGGLCTFFSSQLIGKFVDKKGRFFMFFFLTALSVIPIFLVTHVKEAGFIAVILMTVLFMMIVSGRFVPLMTILTSVVSPQKRGAFLGVNNSLQQMAAGLATLISGWIITKSADGRLEGFDLSGKMGVAMTLTCLGLGYFLHQKSKTKV